ncbi:exodeoxyribonuclease VII large subunit [Psychrobacter raelei]|uniref:Exodeoxyribonuclease VII large subunit n=1 Tax=Psychrobacter raelei TaxID=2565531 RepID=A0AAU6PWQ2_9GAMM
MPKPDLSRLDSLPSDGSGFDAENFDSDELIDPVADELENTVLRLSDYLAAVELVVKETFSHSVWVKAEIRNLSSKGGHYYFELAEKDDDGKVIASCRGNLWRFKAARVLAKFERATGMALERDVTVLLNVTANFHPLYGFSLTINDIDPSYTLGDLARQYAAMLERLSAEGLLNLNKQVPAPFDIEHVLVIAPEKAAGLGDFRADADKLQRTGACHFHDHYDHLDHKAIKQLAHKVGHFYVPLGVKAHLILWGVAADNISEYDWYESASITGGASLSKDEITLTFAPTRHFSGRRLTGQNTSLWGSWAVQSQQLSVYFSGDGGYSEEFAKIGERFGGFDVAFIEDGAYNQSWRNVHMMPEESAQAGIDVQAKVVLPIHWGKFDLSVHHWREPVRRLKLAFDNYNSTQPAKHRIKVATPRIGQVFTLDTLPTAPWWEHKVS